MNNNTAIEYRTEQVEIIIKDKKTGETRKYINKNPKIVEQRNGTPIYSREGFEEVK